MELLSSGSGTDIIKPLRLFFKIWKHTVSIASSSPTNVSCLNTAIPIFSLERIPEIGEEPDFIFESEGTVDLEFVEEAELIPPKMVYGSQLLHTKAL